MSHDNVLLELVGSGIGHHAIYNTFKMFEKLSIHFAE
jgi:hypothetical protein